MRGGIAGGWGHRGGGVGGLSVRVGVWGGGGEGGLGGGGGGNRVQAWSARGSARVSAWPVSGGRLLLLSVVLMKLLLVGMGMWESRQITVKMITNQAAELASNRLSGAWRWADFAKGDSTRAGGAAGVGAFDFLLEAASLPSCCCCSCLELLPLLLLFIIKNCPPRNSRSKNGINIAAKFSIPLFRNHINLFVRLIQSKFSYEKEKQQVGEGKGATPAPTFSP